MGEDAHFCAAKPRSIHNAGVNEFVENNDVVFAEQCADGSKRRGIAGRESERGFGVFEGGKRFLKFVMRRQRTANQPRRTRPAPNFLTALMAASLSDGSLARPR